MFFDCFDNLVYLLFCHNHMAILCLWGCLIDLLYAVFDDLIVLFYWVCIKMKHLVLILIVLFFILTFYLVLVILLCSLGFQTLGLALAAFFLDIVVGIHRLKFVFDIYDSGGMSDHACMGAGRGSEDLNGVNKICLNLSLVGFLTN